jgi:hypothetical protein
VQYIARDRLSFGIKPKPTSSVVDAWAKEFFAKEFFPGSMCQLQGWKARVFASPSVHHKGSSNLSRTLPTALLKSPVPLYFEPLNRYACCSSEAKLFAIVL